MKSLFVLLITTCFFSACKSPAVGNTDNKLVFGTIITIQSAILHEPRKIWIYVPDSYKYNPATRQRFPVVYLLDGDAHLFSVAGMIQQLSSVNDNTICPEMIVVGILNTDRTRDLTPTHVVSDHPYMDSSSSKTSGGGELFMSFIEKELKPHIDSMYPTQPYNILIGHSFGGLTVMNTLLRHPKLFNAYVAIDPSMWWDHQKLLKEIETNLSSTDLSHTALFLGMANTMEAGMDTSKIQQDTVPDSKHIRSILELSHYLKDEKQSGLKFAFKYYDTDDHSSVPLISEYDALHYLFNYYPLKLTYREFSNITMDVITKIEHHYDTISANLGFTVYPPENIINQLALQASGAGHRAEALYLAQLNTIHYPASANAFDTMGDIYSAANNIPAAIESYKKALDISSQPGTRKKLEKLQHK